MINDFIKEFREQLRIMLPDFIELNRFLYSSNPGDIVYYGLRTPEWTIGELISSGKFGTVYEILFE